GEAGGGGRRRGWKGRGGPDGRAAAVDARGPRGQGRRDRRPGDRHLPPLPRRHPRAPEWQRRGEHAQDTSGQEPQREGLQSPGRSHGTRLSTQWRIRRMIASLRGTVVEKGSSDAVIDVNGVGYRVFLSLLALTR